MTTASAPCPCGSARAYAACCGPLHLLQRDASTAEELMRSRYTAYVHGLSGYLARTWHPRTRPADLDLAHGPSWTGLTVLAADGGGPADEVGTVTFEATYRTAEGPAVLAETSRFVRRGGRWVYLDGDVG